MEGAGAHAKPSDRQAREQRGQPQNLNTDDLRDAAGQLTETIHVSSGMQRGQEAWTDF